MVHLTLAGVKQGLVVHISCTSAPECLLQGAPALYKPTSPYRPLCMVHLSSGIETQLVNSLLVWNPKVHFSARKGPAVGSYLEPVEFTPHLTSNLSKFHFNIILLSTP